MENKYLEKIAFMGIVKGIAKPIWGAAKDVGRSIGTNAHLAFGGGARDFAVKHGVTDVNRLSKIGLGTQGRRELFRSTAKSTGVDKMNFGQRRKFIKQTTQGLKDERNKGILKTVAYAGGGLYAGNKILNKVNDMRQPQQDYNGQYY